MIGTNAFGAESSPNKSHEFLAVRLNEPASPLLVKAIAEFGTPLVVSLKTGANLGSIIINRCGLIDPTYVGLLLHKNPHLRPTDLTSLSSNARVTLPACLKAPRPSKVSIHEGDTLNSLAGKHGIALDWSGFVAQVNDTPCRSPNPAICAPSHHTDKLVLLAQEPKYSDLTGWGQGIATDDGGTRSPNTNSAQFHALTNQSHEFQGEYNARQIFHYNPRIDLSVDPAVDDLHAMHVFQSLILPSTQPTWSTVQLAPGVSRNAAVAKINEAAAAMSDGNSPVSVEHLTEAHLIGRVLAAPDGTPPCKAPPPATPLFDSTVLARYLNDYRDKNSAEPTVTTILVLDTGLDDSILNGTQIPRAYARKTKGFTDEYTASAVNVYTGVNFATRENDPKTLSTDVERWHGLGVAGVALGGSDIEQLRRAMTLPVRLSFGNMEKQATRGVTIDPGSLTDGLKYAIDNDIHVVNVSMELFQPGTYLDDEMKLAADSVLIVAAAGNDGGDVGNPTDKRWPALFGGNPKNSRHGAVITVGAEDGNHARAGFSRTGENYVDLLAPGCDVPTYTGDSTASHITAQKADLTGTSFAAPLVSFVAALLSADGFKPGAIKTRLLTSVDVRDSLAPNTYSRGTLNVPRALAIYDDAIERKSDLYIHYGRLLNKTLQNRATLCGEDFLVTQFAKLAIVDHDNDRYAHIWLKGQDPVNNPLGFERRPVCKLQPNDQISLSLQNRDLFTQDTITLNDLRDYTPSM